MTEQNQLNWQRDNFESIEEAWQGDLWDRKRLGIQLTNYVDRLQCGAVLALDARWGEGKTWFVRHWQKHLENEGHNVIYLDAFANDYLDDPFLVISSEIASKLDQTADKSLVYKFKKAAAVLQQGLLTQAPTIIASMISFALTGGIIPFLKIDNDSIKDKYEDIVDKVTDNIGEKVTEAIQKKIDDYEEEKQSLNAFKETLAKLAESLDKPLVFIIDELDRCRPDFAIRLIERIKHFFDIKNIVFVLVMDKTQFSKVVCHNYGYDEDLGEKYLDKFVDFLVPLPKISYASKKQLLHFDALRTFLKDVGESLSDICLIFYFSQYGEYLSPREIRKKINIYALLKTSNQKANLFLALAVMSNPQKLIEKMLNIEKLILDHYNTKYMKIGDKDWKVNAVKNNSQSLEAAVLTEFNIKTPILFEFLKSYKEIKNTNFAFEGGESYKNERMNKLLSNYSINKIIDQREFSNYFDDYLRSCL